MKPPRLLFPLVLLLFLLLSLPFAASAEETGIKSVRVGADRASLTVSAVLPKEYAAEHSGRSCYLFALSPADIAHPGEERKPVASQPAAEEMTFSVPLSPISRLFCYYCLAEETEEGTYSLLGAGGFVSDPEALAENTDEYPAFASKKGLQVQNLTDAQLLGVSHATVNVVLDALLLPEKTEDSVSFLYCGQTFSLDRAELELLDHRVRTLSEAGTNVILSLLLSPAGVATLPQLYYEGVTGTEAELYAICLGNRETELFYEGLLRFLTARYTRADRAYGFAGSFILGYEVNSAKYRNFMGPHTVEEYAAEYARLYRVTDAAVRSVYAEGRVYVPIANNYSVPSITSTDSPDPMAEYPAKEFLTAFNDTLSGFGSFPWRVSVNAYASDLSLTDIRSDPYALDGADTPVLSVENIGVLCDLLASEEFRYRGEARHLMIGEFGVSGKAGTESEELQTAMFLYAYYKVLREEQIDALIWHRHIDHPGENGLCFGLWSIGENGLPTKKDLWRMFCEIDTSHGRDKETEDLMKTYAVLLGKETWEEVFGTALPDRISRILIEGIPAPDLPDKKMTENALFDFSMGDRLGFYPSDGARYLELRTEENGETVLYAELAPEPLSSSRGIAASLPADALGENGLLTVGVKLDREETEGDVSLLLRLIGVKKETGLPCIFEGKARLAGNEWTDVTFDLSEYRSEIGSVSGIRIWVQGAGEETLGLNVRNVSLLTEAKESSYRLLILLAIAAAGLIGVTVAVVTVIYLRHLPKKEKGSDPSDPVFPGK